MTIHSYSFKDVLGTLVGPGGLVNIGSGGGASDEGITIDPSEDVGTMTIGADGDVMFSLHAARPARCLVRLLKTSPTNALLSAMYALQINSAALFGRNTLVITDKARGDLVRCVAVAFARHPNITYSKDANVNEWAFVVGNVAFLLGAGQ